MSEGSSSTTRIRFSLTADACAKRRRVSSFPSCDEKQRSKRRDELPLVPSITLLRTDDESGKRISRSPARTVENHFRRSQPFLSRSARQTVTGNFRSHRNLGRCPPPAHSAPPRPLPRPPKLRQSPRVFRRQGRLGLPVRIDLHSILRSGVCLQSRADADNGVMEGRAPASPRRSTAIL